MFPNACVYKIYSKSANLTYYGSTCVGINSRFSHHKSQKKRYALGLTGYTSSFEVLEHPDAKIIKVMAHPCGDRNELLKLEAWYIDHNDCVNARSAWRSDEYKKQKNIENCAKYRKTKVNCKCGGKYTAQNRSKHRKTNKHKVWLSTIDKKASKKI